MEVIARMRIKGLGSFPKTNWHVVNIPLSSNGKSYRIPKILPIKKALARRYILRLLINNVYDFQTNHMYPEIIREKAKEGTLLLEDLLTLGSKATFQILAFGYDEFSGARKLFVSKLYTRGDIREGPFDPRGLEVKELPAKKPEETRADFEEGDD